MNTLKAEKREAPLPGGASFRKYFGTDGIRGVANRPPLTPEFILQLGVTVGNLLLERASEAGPPRANPAVVIGKDTRISGGMLESALASGLATTGVDVFLVGVIPTPAVALLTRKLGAAMGVVISASHNPYPDNGIKFFDAGGYKLGDARELEIESRLEAACASPRVPRPTGGNLGRLATLIDASERYIDEALHTVSGSKDMLREFKIALDNANGAATTTSAAILEQLGAEVILIASEPNGVNINEDCGCTHPGAIRRAVLETGAQVGVAHDGDADRVLLCDENGEMLDGDEILAIAAGAMMRTGTLAKNTLVTNVMSNWGLNDLMDQLGGRVVRTAVGDRHVMERMRADDLNFGGEQSGHFIFGDHTTTGDGIIAALQILEIMALSGSPLSELRRVLKKYPQVQRNLRVSSTPPLEELAAAQQQIQETEKHLGEAGRVLLRYSGTEPLIRLLIEGKDRAYLEAQADRIAGAIAGQIGV